MEYPSSYQIFGNQYYDKAKQRKQPPKLQHHQTESTKVRQQVWFYTGLQPKSANQKRPQNISILCEYINTKHTLTHLNPTQDAIDKKSSLCRRVSEAAKNHLGVNITGINKFDAIGQLHPSAPPTSKPKTSLYKGESSFKFTASTKLTKLSAIPKPLSPSSTTNKAVPKQPKSSK